MEKLAKRGARLVCLERKVETLDALVASLHVGTEVLTLPGIDLTDSAGCRNAALEAEDRFGKINALVNTAGSFKMAPVDAERLAQWDTFCTMNARMAPISAADAQQAAYSA